MKLFSLLILLTITIAGCVQSWPQSTNTITSTPVAQNTPVPTATPISTSATSPSTNVIQITASVFDPKELTIKAGETVTWINKDSSTHWPASAAHPTHRVYPGSDIDKCGTAEAGRIFDACKGLPQGDAYVFKFDHGGTWSYHDHLNPSSSGKIVVG